MPRTKKNLVIDFQMTTPMKTMTMMAMIMLIRARRQITTATGYPDCFGKSPI
jgi:hypothetical protein